MDDNHGINRCGSFLASMCVGWIVSSPLDEDTMAVTRLPSLPADVIIRHA
jgi:hypothetical protein